MLFKDKMPCVFVLIISIQIQDCSVPLTPGVSACIPSLPGNILVSREEWWGEAISSSSLALLHLTTSVAVWRDPHHPPGHATTGRAWFLAWLCPSWGLTGTAAQTRWPQSFSAACSDLYHNQSALGSSVSFYFQFWGFPGLNLNILAKLNL